MQLIKLVLICAAPLGVCGLSAALQRDVQGQRSSGNEAVSTPFVLVSGVSAAEEMCVGAPELVTCSEAIGAGMGFTMLPDGVQRECSVCARCIVACATVP
eukprot:1885393-Amphidinium_carterae.3